MKPTLEQQTVIDHREGTAVVVADPGSGKTSTIAERSKVMTRGGLLNLAFNKKAAEEMAARTIGTHATNRTYHAEFFRHIRDNAQAYGFSTSQIAVSTNLFADMCEANRSEWYGWDKSPWDYDLVVKVQRNRTDAELASLAENDIEFEETYRGIIELRAWYKRTGTLSFDCMSRLVAQRLRDTGGRDPLPECEHMQIDEFQDTDRFQFEIAVAWAKHLESLVVVGDPKQRIYEWRGALEDAFSDAAKMFPNAATLRLSQNFRSYDGIIRLAEETFEVGMHGIRGEPEEGSVHSQPSIAGIDSLTEQLLLLQQPGPKLRERTILCRLNLQCAIWQLQLAREGVPVMLLGKDAFWAAAHIKLATKARDAGWNAGQLFARSEWIRFTRKSVCRDKAYLAECEAEVRWLLGLNAADYQLLLNALQNENGVRVSTIHKAKGLEWPWVMVTGAEKLKREPHVWYVGITRAKDKLILA